MGFNKWRKSKGWTYTNEFNHKTTLNTIISSEDAVKMYNEYYNL